MALPALRAHFFATSADLAPGLRSLERTQRLQYLLDRAYEAPQAQAWSTAFEIPRLSEATDRRSARYLVMSEGRIVYRRVVVMPKVRPGWRRNIAFVCSQLGIKLPGGQLRYEIRPNDYPGSVLFAPGGSHDDAMLLAGEIIGFPGRGLGCELYTAFEGSLFDRFEKIKSFWVGPEAATLLDRGWRLTTDAMASPSHDLRRD